jgi:hypothetical protein
MKPPLETSLAYKYFVAYRLYDGQRFDEVVIPYRPKHSFQKKIRKVLHSDKRVQLALVVLCLLSLALCWPGLPIPVLLLIALAAAGWSAMQMYTAVQPTHFGLSAKGLRLYWIRWFGDNSSDYIPWKKISHVQLRSAREFNLLPESWIDFISTDGGNVLSLRVDGIVTGEQRKRLHTALKQFVPQAAIDAQLHDLLNPVRVDSYTHLWLEVLATSPQRLRQDVLPPNATIANDRYEIVRHIGAGGQGVAYLGRAREGAFAPNSPALDVVLKEFVLPYHGGLTVTKKALDNIQHEADLLKRLTHPRIVRLVDLFVEDQRAYLVLEHVEGESLRDIVKQQGAYSEPQAIEIGIQMCDILTYLHSQDPPVLHRDFTPENLIMSQDGQITLIDFNVAQVMQANATRTVVGKHSYIPPEQFRGKATPQSDLYALGASLYYLLTGAEPEPITPAHPRQLNSSVSAELDDLIAKATATECGDRLPNAEAMKAALLKLRSRTLSGTPT